VEAKQKRHYKIGAREVGKNGKDSFSPIEGGTSFADQMRERGRRNTLPARTTISGLIRQFRLKHGEGLGRKICHVDQEGEPREVKRLQGLFRKELGGKGGGS